MEAENIVSQVPKKKGGFFTFFLGLLSILILFGALGGAAYYYFVLKDSVGVGIRDMQTPKGVEVNKLVEQIKIKNGEIQVLQEENMLLKKQVSSIAQRLNYIIKPQAQFVGECYSAGVGKWKLPTKCIQDLNLNVTKLLQNDKKVLVFEVIGIVDEKKYRGRSIELKQEGLASFRAKGVIEELRKNFPNVAVFEGLSEQKTDKRGFAVRAYYVE